MTEADFSKFFGFGGSGTNKVTVQPITSVGTLTPRAQLTKVQPSTSAGLVIGNLALPWNRFSGVLNFMPTTSAVVAIVMQSSAAGGNIAKGMTLVAGQVSSLFCDGTLWWPLGSSSS